MAGANGRRPVKPADDSAAHPVRPRRRTGRPAGAKHAAPGAPTPASEPAPSEFAPPPERPPGLAPAPAGAASPADGLSGSASSPENRYQLSRLAVARAAYAAARSTPGVVGVGTSGIPGVRTYGLPGQTVEGVRVLQTSDGLDIEVHLTARLIPLPPLADQVRRAIARALPGQRLAIHIYVDALEEP